MKPAKDEPSRCRAAKEKIASDLAHELGVSVPPVLLHEWDYGTGLIPVCLSRVCYRSQYHLVDLLDSRREDGGLKGPMFQLIARMLKSPGFIAFDAWLANTDRANDGNVMVGFETDGEDVGELLFIDFSNAMMWSRADLAAFQKVSVLPVLQRMTDADANRHIAERIRDLPVATVEVVLHRIPEPFLRPVDRDLLLEGLIARKQRICDEFATWYPV